MLPLAGDRAYQACPKSKRRQTASSHGVANLLLSSTSSLSILQLCSPPIALILLVNGILSFAK